MHNCLWAGEFFPGWSIASLPVCGKPIMDYQLDECAKLGITDVLILDWGYDSQLAVHLGDGSKWGLHLTYTGETANASIETQLHRHAGFIGDEEVELFLENKVGDCKITSVESYFEANFKILTSPGKLVFPGYSGEQGVYMGMNVVMKSNIKVSPPLFLGDNVRLENGIQLSDGVILGDNVLVDKGTRIRHSIVFGGTYLGQKMDIENKIVVGGRVIAPEAHAFVDLDDAGLTSDIRFSSNERPVPASSDELAMIHYTANQDLQTDRRIAEALSELALDITALHLKKVKGVYLGGGYGRGEGGAPLYNDLDFFVLTENATEAEKDSIQVMLATAAVKYSALLGVDVDFCRPKNPVDFRKDEKRLMMQELIRGNVPIYGKAESLNFLRKIPAGLLSAKEALRLLVNRGMGLLLARNSSDVEFVKRNINKAILGAGDARLIVEGRYAWTARMRALLLKDPLYDRALEFKFTPQGEVATWEQAYAAWLTSVQEMLRLKWHIIKRPSIFQALRWVVRRHTFGDWKTFGRTPLYRILVPLRQLLAQGKKDCAIPDELMKDWRIFN